MLVNQQVHKHVQDIQEQKREQTPIIIKKEGTCSHKRLAMQGSKQVSSNG
jgi:hypothetical protein